MLHNFRRIKYGLLLILLSAGMAAQGTVIEIITTPDLDGSVQSSNRNGIFDRLDLRNNGAFFNGSFDLSRVVMEFDLSGIPTGSTINSASVQINASAGGSNRSTLMQVRQYIGNGVLEIGDATPLGPVVGTVSVTPSGGGGIFALDPAFIQQAISLSEFAGIQVLDRGGNSVSLSVRTSEQGSFIAPRLTIDFDSVFLPDIVDPNGVFHFNFDVTEAVPVRIDPFFAVGYDYEIGANNPLFTSVLLPEVGNNLFDLWLFDETGMPFDSGIELTAGTAFDFTSLGTSLGGINYSTGAARFRILGIETDALLDPLDTAAFVTTLTFAGSGTFNGTMTPITEFVSSNAAPEPATLALLALGLTGIGFSRRKAYPGS